MSNLAPEKLVIAISSRALFNLDAEHLVYEEQGLEAYSAYQIEHEDTPLDPGQAFNLAKKLLALNDVLSEPLGLEITRQQRLYPMAYARNTLALVQIPQATTIEALSGSEWP